MSWDDVVAAQKKQDQKVVSKRSQAERKTKRKATVLQACRRKRSQLEEIAGAEGEILAAGLAGFRTVFGCGYCRKKKCTIVMQEQYTFVMGYCEKLLPTETAAAATGVAHPRGANT